MQEHGQDAGTLTGCSNNDRKQEHRQDAGTQTGCRKARRAEYKICRLNLYSQEITWIYG
jgi:hypothetical protein